MSIDAIISRIAKKIKARAAIGPPDELEMDDVVRIARKTGFYYESERYICLAVICIEQADRHNAMEEP